MPEEPWVPEEIKVDLALMEIHAAELKEEMLRGAEELAENLAKAVVSLPRSEKKSKQAVKAALLAVLLQPAAYGLKH